MNHNHWKHYENSTPFLFEILGRWVFIACPMMAQSTTPEFPKITSGKCPNRECVEIAVLIAKPSGNTSHFAMKNSILSTGESSANAAFSMAQHENVHVVCLCTPWHKMYKTGTIWSVGFFWNHPGLSDLVCDNMASVRLAAVKLNATQRLHCCTVQLCPIPFMMESTLTDQKHISQLLRRDSESWVQRNRNLWQQWLLASAC